MSMCSPMESKEKFGDGAPVRSMEVDPKVFRCNKTKDNSNTYCNTSSH